MLKVQVICGVHGMYIVWCEETKCNLKRWFLKKSDVHPVNVAQTDPVHLLLDKQLRLVENFIFGCCRFEFLLLWFWFWLWTVPRRPLHLHPHLHQHLHPHLHQHLQPHLHQHLHHQRHCHADHLFATSTTNIFTVRTVADVLIFVVSTMDAIACQTTLSFVMSAIVNMGWDTQIQRINCACRLICTNLWSYSVSLVQGSMIYILSCHV